MSHAGRPGRRIELARAARGDPVAERLGEVGDVERLIAEGRDSPIAVCRYGDGVGHPFWLHRSVFGELDRLHGDKGIWKLIESGRVPVRELAVEGTVPPDVDTWDDYQRLLASVAR